MGDDVVQPFEYWDFESDTDKSFEKNCDLEFGTLLKLHGIDSETQLMTDSSLPCEANILLVRRAYQRMYGILVGLQEDRTKHIRAAEPISHRKKFSLILVQPGTGKTWFLTYALLRRVLEGKPTVFQVAKHSGTDGDFTGATHYLVNENVVHEMDPPTLSELNDPEI